jgi:lipopolysaccharide/colanic/teichoic acid biosynthesis glycosyltransferase
MKQTFERLFDVLCAAAGLLLLLPLFAVLALLILWDDGRPVFFSQTRVGRQGKEFRIWKFRTMRAGSPGSSVTAAGDRRVTRAGAPLRRYKLDELPQLYNVLKGEMSLVGPRPEVPDYVQLAAPRWQAVLEVRPGITDLASLLYREEEKLLAAAVNPSAFYRDSILPQKLLLNLAYIRSRSFFRDLKLIILTIRYSMFPGGFDQKRIERLLLTGAPLFRGGVFLRRASGEAAAQGAGDE